MEVQLVSPEKILYSGQATMVLCRTLGGGDIAFLEGHAPFIGALAVHPVLVRTTTEGDLHVAVHGGFVEVSGSTVTILSDVAELPSQIDRGRAEEAKARAEEQLRADAEDAEARAALARAIVRLDVADGRTTAGAH